MSDYAEIGGVRFWYEEHGRDDPLTLLHPAGADSRAFGPDLAALAEQFHVFLVDRRGHSLDPIQTFAPIRRA